MTSKIFQNFFLINLTIVFNMTLANFIPLDNNFRYLSVTLPDPTRPYEFTYWFNNIPLTQALAELKGWRLLTGSDCNNGGRYFGLRYLPPIAPSIVALYDSRGVVCGFQALFRVDSVVNGSSELDCKTFNRYTNNYGFDAETMINRETINGLDYFVLTAYFVPPTEICTSTRNPLRVYTDGFGNQLSFQNGPTPSDLATAPATRAEAASQSWTNNRCLPLNGYHNFYRTQDWDGNNCRNNRPSWLFYDKYLRLSGFGFTIPGCDGSPRFQHPPGLIVKYVSGSECARTIADTVKWSNINVYLVAPASTLWDCLPNLDFLNIFQVLRQIIFYPPLVTPLG